MENSRIVVGREGCTLKDVWEIIEKCTVLWGKWSEFARHLGIGGMEINELRQRKQLDKITHSDLIDDILENWVAGSGADATLDTLLHVVEEDCQASVVGESLRHRFKLPSKLREESPAPLSIMIPDRPTYYIPRTLITRNIISADIFQNNSPDIFLIEDMDRSELRKLVKDKLTGDSKEQITCAKIEPRFIILNQRNHFCRICEKIGKLKPVHCLRKEEDGRLRWIRSHGGDITYLQGCLDPSQDELNEHDFCQTLATQRAPVCISDSPGMGKSLLLAEIGSRLTKIFPDRKVSFIALAEFIKLVKQVGTDNLANSFTEVFQNSFGWTFPTPRLDSEDEEEISFELLLDGFDELDSQDHQMGYELLKTIQDSLQSIRLWVTSRPHLLAELERHVNQLGYNIRAFHLDDQIQFLSSYWSRKTTLDRQKCQRFAKCCLEALKSKMNSTDQDIAGIPLQCLLIGESYAEDAVDFARLDNKNEALAAADIEIGTISNLYRSLIEKKIQKYESMERGPKLSERELMTIHARLGWEFVFPDHVDDLGSVCGPVGEREMDQVLKVGILETSGSIRAPRFLHRTFAEYFIAWYIIDELDRDQESLEGLSKCFLRVLDSRSQIEMKLKSFRFNYPVITYFLDALIPEVPTFSVSSKEFPSSDYAIRIAHSCINANYIQLFGLLSSLSAIEKHAREIFSNKFICLAIWNSNLELTKSVLNIFENHHKFDPTIQVEALRTAVKRGKYSIIEYLLTQRNLQQIVKEQHDGLSGLIHDCIENSKKCIDAEIVERKLILRLLVDINPTLLETKGGAWNEKPILSFGVHVRLLEELIRLGADMLVQDDQGNTILHMNYSRNHLSNKDYHELVQSFGKEQRRKLVHLKGEGQDTPLISILRWIDPLLETLESFEDAGASFNSIDVNGYSVLEIAIRNGRTTNKLIEFGAKINWKPLRWLTEKLGLKGKQGRGKTLLHYAAANGNIEAVELLLGGKRMDVDLKDEDGLTPLDYCIRNYKEDGKHSEVALLLKNRGCTLTKHCDSTGYNFLNMAVERSNIQFVQLLIDLGVDVNLKDENGDTALHLVAYFRTDESKPNNFPILQILLANGANIEILNDVRHSSWDIAFANMKYYKFKHFLIDIGMPVSSNFFVAVISTEGIWDSEHFHLFAQDIVRSIDVNYQDSFGNSLLHIVAEEGTLNAVNFLISSGANTNLINNIKETPLHSAGRNNDKTVSLELIKILIKNGADPNVDITFNRTFLHFYIGSHSEKCPSSSQFHQMVEYLSSKSLSSLFTSNRCAALHLALKYVELEEKTLSLLNACGADLNEVDYSGDSALNFAIRGNRSIKLIDALINRFGANPKNLNHEKSSLLHEAASNGTPEALDYLLKLKLLDVNGLNMDWSAPLHFIFKCKSRPPKNAFQKCKLLIDHGADVNIINKNGKTAFAEAQDEYNNQEDRAVLLRLTRPTS